MEFQSDYSKVAHLFELSDDVDEIHFATESQKRGIR